MWNDVLACDLIKFALSSALPVSSCQRLSAAVSGCQRSAVSAVSAVSAIRAVRPSASAPAPIPDPDPSGHYYHTELALAPATGHPPHPRAPAAYPPTPCKFGPFRISLPILREYSKSIRHDTLQRTNHRGVKPTAVKVRHALHIRARINARSCEMADNRCLARSVTPVHS